MSSALPVPRQSENQQTRKIMVLTFNRADYQLLEEKLAEAQRKVPDLVMDSMCSAMLAEICRALREPIAVNK